jgi:hypothetical protein
MHRSHFRMPRAGGRKQPWHGNVQGRPFDIPPRGLTARTILKRWRAVAAQNLNCDFHVFRQAGFDRRCVCARCLESRRQTDVRGKPSKLQSAAWGSALVPRPSDYDWLIWSQSRNATRNIFCKGFDEKYIRRARTVRKERSTSCANNKKAQTMKATAVACLPKCSL